jgi:alkylation response protein AidB-like acyl-CoA dehydrogenase
MMFADVHDELRAVARDLLGKVGPGGTPDWRRLTEAGWPGLEVVGALDGTDASFAETALVLAEFGRAAACSPYLGVVLAVGMLNLLEPNPGRDDLLRATAAGDAVPAAALAADGATPGPPFRLERSPRGLRLHGRAAFVPDAAEAGRLLLLALDPGGVPVVVDAAPPADEPSLTAQPLVARAAQPVVARAAQPAPGRAAQPLLSRAAQPVLDATRRLSLVTADGVPVPEASVWRFGTDPAACVGRLLDRAAVAVACDSLGLSEAMLDATVAYARVREQFGRPIGSFQAVKHACADMLVQVSVSRQLVAAAARSLASDSPDAAVAASMAKSYACGAAVDVVGRAMQLHGGMGYTWESGIHVYLKRAMLNRSLFGSPAAHRKRLAARYR